MRFVTEAQRVLYKTLPWMCTRITRDESFFEYDWPYQASKICEVWTHRVCAARKAESSMKEKQLVRSRENWSLRLPDECLVSCASLGVVHRYVLKRLET